MLLTPFIQFKHGIIRYPEPPVDEGINIDPLQTRIVGGEAKQAVMTAKYVPVVNEIRNLDEYFNGFRLRNMLQVSVFTQSRGCC
jgi:hypothetical protein